MVAIGLVELCLIQQLCHAQQCIQRRANLMADVRDKHGLGPRTRFSSVARLFGLPLLAAKPDDQALIVATEANTLVQQTRYSVAITEQNGREKDDEDRSEDLVDAAFDEKGNYQGTK